MLSKQIEWSQFSHHVGLVRVQCINKGTILWLWFYC